VDGDYQEERYEGIAAAVAFNPVLDASVMKGPCVGIDANRLI
jgi:hypothetical protein